MPNFQKDPMTMPDVKGNQWARTGGLFGRNRAQSAPTAAKRPPAANANPFAYAGKSAVMTNGVPQMFTLNKLALYAQGQGPVTRQVPDSKLVKQPIVPSPTTPQPMSATQVGAYPPNAAKTASLMRVLSSDNLQMLFS